MWLILVIVFRCIRCNYICGCTCNLKNIHLLIENTICLTYDLEYNAIYNLI